MACSFYPGAQSIYDAIRMTSLPFLYIHPRDAGPQEHPQGWLGGYGHTGCWDDILDQKFMNNTRLNYFHMTGVLVIQSITYPQECCPNPIFHNTVDIACGQVKNKSLDHFHGCHLDLGHGRFCSNPDKHVPRSIIKKIKNPVALDGSSR